MRPARRAILASCALALAVTQAGSARSGTPARTGIPARTGVPAPVTVQATPGSVTPREGTTFLLRIAVTNRSGDVVRGVNVAEFAAQGTGWAGPVSVVTPAAADLQPGVTRTFAVKCRAMLAGDVTLTFDVTAAAPVAASRASVPFVVVPKKPRAAGTSGAGGRTWLKSGSTSASLRLVDRDTGSPIAGLSAALAADRRSRGRAVLVIADAAGRYPLQFVELRGAPRPKRGRALRAAKSTAPPAPLVVPVQQGAGDVLSAPVRLLETGILPPFVETAAGTGRLPDAMVAALRQITSGDVFLPPPFSGTLPVVAAKETVRSADLREHLRDRMANDTTLAAYSFVVSGMFEPLTAGGALDSIVQDLTVPMLDATASMAFASLGYETLSVLEVRFGGRVFEMTVPSPGAKAPAPLASASLTVSANDASGADVPGAEAEALRADVTGIGRRRAVADGPLMLPPGTYDLRVGAPGFRPDTRQVTLGPGGSSVDLVLAPRAIHAGETLIPADAVYVPNGTQTSATSAFRDAQGIVTLPDGPVVYVASNPAAGRVAEVDPATGLVRVTGDLGAARISAWCAGVTAFPVPVVPDWGGRLPPKPPPTRKYDGHWTIHYVGSHVHSSFGTRSDLDGEWYIHVVNGTVVEPPGTTGTFATGGVVSFAVDYYGISTYTHTGSCTASQGSGTWTESGTWTGSGTWTAVNRH